MKYTEKILVVDLEATCWEGTIPENQWSEVIEIGCTLLNTSDWTIENSFGFLIKPSQSEVSSFCTELTSITQEMLDTDGIKFEEACTRLISEYQTNLYTWASYGAYDFNMMKKECKRRNIENPFSLEHINVKELYSEKFNSNKKIGMSGALNKLNIQLEGTHHRGIDDSRNIAKILKVCLKDK